jgi:hypothetical protein
VCVCVFSTYVGVLHLPTQHALSLRDQVLLLILSPSLPPTIPPSLPPFLPFSSSSLGSSLWLKLKYTMMWGRDELVHEQLSEVQNEGILSTDFHMTIKNPLLG